MIVVSYMHAGCENKYCGNPTYTKCVFRTGDCACDKYKAIGIKTTDKLTHLMSFSLKGILY